MLIDSKIDAELIKTILSAHEADVKSVTDSKNAEIETLKTDHESETSDLQSKLEELTSKIETTERITKGTYAAKNKKVYKFKDGVLDFRFKSESATEAEDFETKEALKNKALMEELISIGAGFIEEVKS